jgi:hypothetical protein
MKKTLIFLGLMAFGIYSQAKADSCDGINQGYAEYKLVCAATPEDLNRIVNAVRLTSTWWRFIGAVNIQKKDGFNWQYCQLLYRNN